MASAPGLGSPAGGLPRKGAYRNGKRIHVSNVRAADDEAMVFTTGTGAEQDKLASREDPPRA